jgi:hypothetical protein
MGNGAMGQWRISCYWCNGTMTHFMLLVQWDNGAFYVIGAMAQWRISCYWFNGAFPVIGIMAHFLLLVQLRISCYWCNGAFHVICAMVQ